MATRSDGVPPTAFNASTIDDDILGSSAGDNYTEMLEQERAKSMAQNMNLGIAEALVKQFDHGARKPSGN